MDYMDKIKKIITKEARKVEGEQKMVPIKFLAQISDDSDFEDVIINDIKEINSKKRKVEKILREDRKKNFIYKESGLVSHIVKKRKVKRKLTIKKAVLVDYEGTDVYEVQNKTNILKNSNMYKEMAVTKRKRFIHNNRKETNRLINRIKHEFICSNLKKKGTNVNSYRSDGYFSDEEEDFPEDDCGLRTDIRTMLETLFNKIKGDQVIMKKREENIQALTQRLMYWMNKAEDAENKLEEINQLIPH